MEQRVDEHTYDNVEQPDTMNTTNSTQKDVGSTRQVNMRTIVLTVCVVIGLIVMFGLGIVADKFLISSSCAEYEIKGR